MARPDLSVFALLFVLFTPIIVPIGLCLGFFKNRRLRSLAKTTACTDCQTVFGIKALRLADLEWKDYLADLRARHPNAKLRIVRSLHAICSECGAQYIYSEGNRSFRRIVPKARRNDARIRAATGQSFGQGRTE